jgi:chemotaxis protein MotB
MADFKKRQSSQHDDGEFLWLVSLSDLMILLFVFFVVLFSFSYKKMTASDLIEAVAAFNGNANTPIDQMERELTKSLADKKISDEVTVEQQGGSLLLSIKGDILFPSGGYRLQEQSRELLKTISDTLRNIPIQYKIAVEGFTDDVPYGGHGGAITDNWQLSFMRAHEVFLALNLQPALEERSAIIGYGPNRPLVPNRDENGKIIESNQAKNRRVTIRVY